MDIHKLYDSLDIDEIDRMIADKQEENLYMEFKLVDKPGMSRNDRKILSKCISGFANSGGGLIIWGIDARQDDSGVDCASEKKPISDLALFLSRLTGNTGGAVTPIVDGITHRKIEEEKDSGYVATLIPESASGPHMAKHGEHRYYKRSGESFYKMEHFDIEDMFGRRKKPILAITTRLRRKGDRTKIVVGIRNEGRGSAKGPYLAFNSPAPFSLSTYGYDGNGNEGLPRLSPGSDGMVNRYGANSNFIVHPGTTLDITALDLGMPGTTRKQPPEEISITYEVAAEDQRFTRSTVIVDLRSAIESDFE